MEHGGNSRRHVAAITEIPKLSGKNSTPDGAITGNGDVAVILGNAPDGLRIYLAKADVWHAVENEHEGGIRPVGWIDLPMPSGLYERYYAEQDMDAGVVRCRFSDGACSLRIEIRVAAEENAVLIETEGDLAPVPVLSAYDCPGATGRNGGFSEGGVMGISRSFEGGACLYETHVFAVLRTLCDRRFCVFLATNHEGPDPRSEVLRKTAELTSARFEALKEAHAAFWRDFWARSSMRLSDPALENEWYAAHYFLAVSARNRRFPPGLYANFITVERPNWHGDYHLNYNYQAPFYAACSSNHPELTDCYMAPLEDFLPRGKEFAARLGCRGVLYPCGIGPKGYMTEFIPGSRYEFERPFMGQKSDALHAADIAVFRWNATRDPEFAREHAYPYLKACLDFFTDYAVLDNGRYSVPDDAAHEVPYYRADFEEKDYPWVHDKNNVVTLGLLRLCIPAAIDMAETLGVDEEKRSLWRAFLAKLSPFPTFIRRGRRVYRYTESGMAWCRGNDVGQQHIFPCGCVGLSSPAEDLVVARNTVRQRTDCFTDGNAVSSFYAIAARTGFDPAFMLKKLRRFNRESGLPNLLHHVGGGGLEYCAVNATALNEMALQSHQGVVRIFPDWDESLDCSYRDLRADGAFLVSAEIRSGIFRRARIFCERGGSLRAVFPAERVRITVNGADTELSAAQLEYGVRTAPGDEFLIENADVRA